MKCMGGWNLIPAIRITSNPVALVQLNSVDAIQGNAALSIAESIALLARLDELRNTVQPPPEREVLLQAQEQQRPLPELDRPVLNPYDDGPPDSFNPMEQGGGYRARYGY